MACRESRAALSSLPSRRMPTCFHITSRSFWRAGEAGGLAFGAAAWALLALPGLGTGLPGMLSCFFLEPGASCIMAMPERAPKTRPSRRELLARRLAPWTPVAAVSPAA